MGPGPVTSSLQVAGERVHCVAPEEEEDIVVTPDVSTVDRNVEFQMDNEAEH